MTTDEMIRSMYGDMQEMKGDIRELKTDVAGLKTDVAELKTDVAGLKTDVAELKTDVAGLKTDVAELKASVRNLEERVDENTEKINGLYVLVENSICPALKLIAENHCTLNDKLNTAGCFGGRCTHFKTKDRSIISRFLIYRRRICHGH
jgi:chromosome segregation ATPase